MSPRAAFFSSFVPMLLGLIALPACLPLSALDEYMEGGAGGIGGELGNVDGDEAAICGNGVVEGKEECDGAGITTECFSDCKKAVCQRGCECRVLNGSYLSFCSTRSSFAGARQACSAAGLSFEIPQGREEDDFLQAWAARLGFAQSWIGGTDSVDEGEWVSGGQTLFWTTGEDGGTENGVYVNFAEGQPDDYNASQHCSVLELASGWDDASCDLRYPYVCVGRPPAPPATCGNAKQEAEEACDPVTKAACDADCTSAACGDGITNKNTGEQCDDGNTEPLDACDKCKSTGLLAHWSLTEATGPRAFDVASYRYHGDLVAPSSYRPQGGGLTFDGQTQAVLVPNSREPSVVGEITSMALLRTGAPPPDPPQYQVILTHANNAARETWLRLNGTDLQGGSWWGDGSVSTRTPLLALWEEDRFHHVAARYDGQNWTVFHDGEIISTSEGDTGSLEMSGTWHIGGRPEVGGRYFTGVMRDVRLYDRALSDAQVLALANHALRPSTAP